MKKVRILILSIMMFSFCASSAFAVTTLELSEKFEPIEAEVDVNIQEAEDSLLDWTYPVGAVYITESDLSESDMHKMFGGTWKRMKNTFLWAVDEDDTPGATGGKAEYELSAVFGTDGEDEFAYQPSSLSAYMSSHNPNFSFKGVPLEDADEAEFLEGSFSRSIPVTVGKKRTLEVMPKFTAVRMFKRVE